ncbi:MAG: hypothetical protein JXA73_04910 [Acidobacteria bacterium]|nr:hypothetical protein [Acidobacteriota bacterium]
MSLLRTKNSRRILVAMGLMLSLYLLLLIPESEAPVEAAVSQPVRSRPFVWKQDAFWRNLEAELVEARRKGCPEMLPGIEVQFARADIILQDLASREVPSNDPLFQDLEEMIFRMAPWVAACPARLGAFNDLVAKVRLEVKRQSRHWDMASPQAQTVLYRLLYGGRAAVEEILLQVPRKFALPELVMGKEESSQTPWASILGAKIHSGDILISRGGAATSALIARGNDFAGNFSHIALVYVHPKTHLASIVESHIERGITISSLEDYLRDIKLRVMVLRLRSDLPALIADPMLPHRAAEYALMRAQREHIPYDFAMDFSDTSKLFCSEVASAAYRANGINLWMNLSQISSPGLRRWLAFFGVRNFITQEPSDLEYDPQLQIVAEWRDLETLRKDHLDNAVTEVMLDGASMGEPARYNRYLLPFARLAKAYSYILNCVGLIGPVPEGMSATAALRNRWYTSRHAAIKDELTEEAESFEQKNEYVPPYWRLVEMAQRAKDRM